MKHCLPKRFFKDMCFLVFCKMKMSVREATLNLQKPCMSARIAPWLAVIGMVGVQSYVSLKCQQFIYVELEKVQLYCLRKLLYILRQEPGFDLIERGLQVY
jgi:hypothetical protein